MNTLRSSRAIHTRRPLQSRVAGITLRALRAGVSLRALGAVRAVRALLPRAERLRLLREDRLAQPSRQVGAVDGFFAMSCPFRLRSRMSLPLSSRAAPALPIPPNSRAVMAVAMSHLPRMCAPFAAAVTPHRKSEQ